MKANSVPIHSDPLRRLRGPRAVLAGMAAGAMLLMLGSCAERAVPVAPPPPPPPRMMPPPPPVPQAATADWHDAPLTPGEWRWDGNGESTATFAGPNGRELLSLSCKPQRGVLLYLADSSQADGTAQVTISTSSLTRNLLAQTQRTDPPLRPQAVIAVNDPLLDAMAFARGRFMVQAPYMPTLILLARPEISRVIEDCRRH